MEPRPGVFVSTTGTDDWAPDPGVPGTDVHVVVEADGISAGMTRMLTVEGPLHWTPDRRETVLVLEGHVRIEIEGGEPIELGPGAIGSLPPGVATVWHVTPPFKEFWVIG